MKRTDLLFLLCSIFLIIGTSKTLADTLPFIIKTDQGVAIENIKIRNNNRSFISDSLGKGVMNNYYQSSTISVGIGWNTSIVIGNDTLDYINNLYFIRDSIFTTEEDTLRITLSTTKFNITREGIAQKETIKIKGLDKYDNECSIITMQTNNQGALRIPVPTAFYYELESYSYNINDEITKAFIPENDVNYDIRYRTVEIYLTAGNEAVEGMIFRFSNKEDTTNNLGHAELSLPAGELNYFAYDSPVDEVKLAVGEKTYDYNTEREYKAFGFISNTSLSLNNDTIINITLPLSTFSSTADGKPHAVDINIFYTTEEDNGVNSLMNIKTNDEGNATALVPFFTIKEDYKYDYAYGDELYLSDSIYYVINNDIHSGNVNINANTSIDLPAFTDVSFITKTDKGDVVSGITVDISGITAITNELGKATISVPLGERNYSIYTTGVPQELTVNNETFTYLLDDNIDDEELNNIFDYKTIAVTESMLPIDVKIATTTFNATMNGESTALEIMIQTKIGSNDGYYNVIHAEGTTSTLTIPFPLHLCFPNDDYSIPLFNYRYIANEIAIADFQPENIVDIRMTTPKEVNFTVKSNGKIVENMIIEVDIFRDTSDINGMVHFKLMEGDYTYNILSNSDLPYLIIGGDTIEYNYEDNGYYSSEYFENYVFATNMPFSVSTNTSRDINLGTTSFTTLYDETEQATSFSISTQEQYIIKEITSNNSGRINIPLPSHTRSTYSDSSEELEKLEELYFNTPTGIIGTNNFTHEDTAIIIETGTVQKVCFYITDSIGDLINNAHIQIDNEEYIDYQFLDYENEILYLDVYKGTHSFVLDNYIGEISGKFTTSNDTTVVPITVGVSPVFSISTSSSDSRYLPQGYEDTATYTISNTGSSPLTITEISFTGENANMFYCPYNVIPLSIANDSSYDIKVICLPTKGGNLNSTCKITTNELGVKTVDISLECTGAQQIPFLEEFDYTYPANWDNMSGTIGEDNYRYDSYHYWYPSYFGFIKNDLAAQFDYGEEGKNWFVSPLINLDNNHNDNILSFDIALTKKYSPLPVIRNNINDIFAVIISTDGGKTWSKDNILQLWDNTESDFIFNDIATEGEEITIDLSSYSGLVRIGFYIESSEGYASREYSDLFLDNVFIGEKKEANQKEIKDNDLKFNVYPNPVTDILHLETEEKCDIQLISLSGVVLKTLNTEGRTSINMNALQSGLYLLHISNGTETNITKVIKR